MYFIFASRGSFYFSVEAEAPKARGHQSHEDPSQNQHLKSTISGMHKTGKSGEKGGYKQGSKDQDRG